jgi:hypothetical protein
MTAAHTLYCVQNKLQGTQISAKKSGEDKNEGWPKEEASDSEGRRLHNSWPNKLPGARDS